MGWQLSEQLLSVCVSALPEAKALITFCDIEAMISSDVRWALIFASTGALPFFLQYIGNQKTTIATGRMGMSVGLVVTALILLVASAIAWIRILTSPEEFLHDSRWIYFCLYGCGFQSAFAILVFAACAAILILVRKSDRTNN